MKRSDFLLAVVLVFGVVLDSVECIADGVSGQKPISVRVMVINFDPAVRDRNTDAEAERLHKVCGWFEPRKLAKQYAEDVREASQGFIQYEIAEWRDVDGFPVKSDGFQYNVESYMACRGGKSEWHQPDLADYPKMMKDYGAIKKIDANQIDEVWIFGGPYFGFHESAMMGPEAFYINGGVYDQVQCSRAFAIMGFNYERGVAEMLHNLCHRTESTMSRVYGGWKVEELNSNWARFASNLKQSGRAGVGSCHYPPNAESGYDYANERSVESTADDWLNYPDLKGDISLVSRDNWGGPDYHRNYMKWWFRRLPQATGTNADGKLNNWWRYLFAFNELAKPK